MTNTSKSNPGESKGVEDKAKAAAGSAVNETKTQARDVADTVATEASSYADQAKGAAADEVKSVASALRAAADEMRTGSPLERTFSQIADSFADASEGMRDKDLGEIVGSLSNFARRNPIVFLGSAALVGFAATRFAKASDSRTGRAPTSHNSGRFGTQADGLLAEDRSAIAAQGGISSPAINRDDKGDLK